MASDYRARREALLEWLGGQGGPRLARDICREFSWHGGRPYWAGYWWEAPRQMGSRDLKALERGGKVRRLPGRPARWEVVRGA